MNYNVKDLKEATRNELSDNARDFVNDNYADDIKYLDDAFRDFADANTSIYTYDQEQFYFNNRDYCDRIAAELCLLESFDPSRDSIGDLISKAGCWGEYESIYEDLLNNEEDIKKFYALEFLERSGVQELTEAQNEYINDWAQDSNNDINDLQDINITEV